MNEKNVNGKVVWKRKTEKKHLIQNWIKSLVTWDERGKSEYIVVKTDKNRMGNEKNNASVTRLKASDLWFTRL